MHVCYLVSRGHFGKKARPTASDDFFHLSRLWLHRRRYMNFVALLGKYTDYLLDNVLYIEEMLGIAIQIEICWNGHLQ